MASFRVSRATALLKMLRKTLHAVSVPPEYKRMLLDGVLAPTTSFGNEIFGSNNHSIECIARVVFKGIACVLKKSNFCRHRAYEELYIIPMEMRLLRRELGRSYNGHIVEG
ncbi:hypothetical protein EDEG_00586 [Edhazardia aedis USNM 41457]|uniref:Uncharacterized protein n=1 Tax=Edhazardia aedis (strain USNM 41457) TaxID=1003232 RepID=J9DS07_EDHAE|nr:hypothetical protein EDEG_00586 [Edhazardia aedis USNM 41457]|eukprot:EJW05360.1 hypothetical protein EDEG_00586 [Edhazardia aedis USNM 41457]